MGMYFCRIPQELMQLLKIFQTFLCLDALLLYILSKSILMCLLCWVYRLPYTSLNVKIYYLLHSKLSSGLLWWLIGQHLPANARDAGSIPGSGRSPGEEKATHSSILAWKSQWTEQPGMLLSTRHHKRLRDGLATKHNHKTKTKTKTFIKSMFVHSFTFD